MDTMATVGLYFCYPDRLNCTHSYVIAPKVRSIAIYTLFNMVPRLIGIFQARTGDANDNNTLSIVYSHLKVAHKKWAFRVADFTLFRQ